jgi:hypothetical protein
VKIRRREGADEEEKGDNRVKYVKAVKNLFLFHVID